MARRSRTSATRTATRRPRSISLLLATVLVALVAAILLASSSSTGPSAVSALPQPADDNNKDNNNKDNKKDNASPTPAPSSASSSAPSPTGSNSASAKPSATGSATGSATPTATNSGNSTNKPATTTVNKPGSNTDLTPTLKPDDPCEDGVCDIKNRGTCLMLEKTGVCKAFSGMYLPLNLRDYFDAKFPLKKPDTIPDNVGNATTFDNLFSMANYGYFGKYSKQYMLLEAACESPNQRWFRTWVCIQMIQWYAAKGNPCSTGLAPKICGSTLDDRANSIEGDIKNKTTCTGASNPIVLDIGTKYVQSIRTLPWRSASAADTSCIAGPNNEADGAAKYCGYSQFAVCTTRTLCPTAPITDEECEVLTNPQKAKLKAQSTTGILDSNDRDGHKSTYYVMGGLGVAALFALGSGLYALTNIRLVGAKTGEAAHAAAPAKPEPAPGASTAKAAPALAPSASIQMKPMPSPAVAPAAVAGMPMAAAAAAAAPGGGERIIEQVQVASPFQASQGDELNLFPGQTVGVYQRFDDGWARGVNMATGQVGFFPYSVCHPQQGPMGARFQSLGRR
ncbi:hypothetical protein GGF32_007043 [Allomyces javanicus]|nr:hypothetical protein GGF32_007043 [Allomyces javanicus]